MNRIRMPSAAELYAYERLARLERAKVQSALIRAAAARVSHAFVSIFTKPYAAARPKVMRHA